VAYNPLKQIDKHELDYTTGKIRVVDDGNTTVIYLQTDNGEVVVLNIIEDNWS
jgi:hypothetical protein